jgi:hypothetical protein
MFAAVQFGQQPAPPKSEDFVMKIPVAKMGLSPLAVWGLSAFLPQLVCLSLLSCYTKKDCFVLS